MAVPAAWPSTVNEADHCKVKQNLIDLYANQKLII